MDFLIEFTRNEDQLVAPSHHCPALTTAQHNSLFIESICQATLKSKWRKSL